MSRQIDKYVQKRNMALYVTHRLYPELSLAKLAGMFGLKSRQLAHMVIKKQEAAYGPNQVSGNIQGLIKEA